jgi:hypothetical protein
MIDNTHYIAVLVGSVFGSLVAYLFKLHSKPSINEFSKEIFNMSSNSFINHLILGMAAMFLVIMTTIGAIVKDTRYITTNPAAFTFETLAAGFGPASLLFLSTWLRGSPFNQSKVDEYIILVTKFGLTHVLFQLSGYYSYIFPSRMHAD